MSISKRKTYQFLLGLLLLIIMPCAFATSVQVGRLHTIISPDRTRLIFEVTGPLPNFHSFVLENPDRIAVDIPDAVFTARPPRSLLTNSVVDDIRSGARPDHKLRIVFDLLAPAKPHIFVMPPHYPEGYRLVVDIYPMKKTPLPLQVKNVINKSSAIITSPINLPSAKLARDIIVVIDPGHGGKDPGATGPGGIHEKNIVLAISRNLKMSLSKIPGIKAVLTRSGDYYLTLRERLNIARKDKADMFIAIHADAYQNASAEGATVFALSEKGASSEAARWLAEKENYSELGGANLRGKDDMLRSVLIDLSQTATISASLQLGAAVLRQLDTVTQLLHNRVEQARFVVLKSPDIFSLLVETGFISNPREERRLNNYYYQRHLAAAIAAGIVNYFMQNPPPDTLFALRAHARKYKVHPGENLASIASKAHLSLPLLKRLNNNLDSAHAGQVILIPGA